MTSFIDSITYGASYVLQYFFVYLFDITNGVATYKRPLYFFIGTIFFIKVVHITSSLFFKKGVKL